MIGHGDTTLPQLAPARTLPARLRDVWREREAVPKTILSRDTLPLEPRPTMVSGSSLAPENHVSLTMTCLTPTTSPCYCGGQQAYALVRGGSAPVYVATLLAACSSQVAGGAE